MSDTEGRNILDVLADEYDEVYYCALEAPDREVQFVVKLEIDDNFVGLVFGGAERSSESKREGTTVEQRPQRDKGIHVTISSEIDPLLTAFGLSAIKAGAGQDDFEKIQNQTNAALAERDVPQRLDMVGIMSEVSGMLADKGEIETSSHEEFEAELDKMHPNQEIDEDDEN